MEKRILVVEDDATNASIAEAFLEAAGYEVQIAETVQAATEKICKNPPHLILLDYMLPDETGIALLKHLKQDPALTRIPVIMATAYSELNIEQLSPQPDELMFKPLRFKQLLEAVARLLSRSSGEV